MIVLFLNASMSADGNARCEESAETPRDSRSLDVQNREKHVVIVKDIVATVPKQMWPASWFGVMPRA